MSEITLKALEEFHKEYKAKIAADIKIKNEALNINKGNKSLKPWNSISKDLRDEFMELADHAITAEHHKEGFIKSDDAVRYSVWVNFKSIRGLK